MRALATRGGGGGSGGPARGRTGPNCTGQPAYQDRYGRGTKRGRATNVPGQRQRLDVDQQQQHGQQLGGGPQHRHDSGGDGSGGGCCGGEDGVEADHSGERVTHVDWPVTGSLVLSGLSENARPGQQNEGEKKEGMEANGDSV